MGSCECWCGGDILIHNISDNVVCGFEWCDHIVNGEPYLSTSHKLSKLVYCHPATPLCRNTLTTTQATVAVAATFAPTTMLLQLAPGAPAV